MAPVGTLMTKLSQNKTAPKWTIGAKSAGQSRPSTPGPGQYAAASRRAGDKRTPAYGFGTSSRDLNRAATAPGPGTYQPEDKAKLAAPRIGFGTGARDKVGGGTFTAIAPGPGAYSPNFAATRSSAAKYTATPRRDSLRGQPPQCTPGPGAYTPKTRVETRNSPQYGFGTSTRTRVCHYHTPGPGAYSADLGLCKEGSPKYTIRSRPDGQAEDYLSSNPGPGGQVTQFG
eukprot:TRINITY_DN12124_c0_g1_i2.p1 TRINITY_DN12124_c0_g1~~TRINITY_DN12124_c0_g1_i2.p1  ORF type:complete len:263 (-),score=15.26 TRINITY_DN12124_c0_g1_i2:68-754(-)